MAHTILVTDNNEVECFAENATVPHLRQPHWPNGEAWANKEEAQTWADAFLLSENDESAPLYPLSRDADARFKPTAEQIEKQNNFNIALNNAKKTDGLIESLSESLKNITTKEQADEIINLFIQSNLNDGENA